MKKLGIVLAVLAVLAALLAGGALYADSRVHALAEQEAQRRVVEALPGARGVTVTIEQWPLLWAVVSGRIAVVTVTAEQFTGGRVQADDLRVEVHDIALDTDVLWSERRLVITGIDRAVLTGTLTQAAVSAAAGVPVELFAGMVKVTTPQGHTLVATLKVEGRKIRLIPPLPGYDTVEFDLPPEAILPCTPQVEVLQGKLALACEVTALPALVQQAMGRR